MAQHGQDSAKNAPSEKRKRDDEPDGLLQGGPPVKLSSGQKKRARQKAAKQAAIAHQFREAAEQAAQEEAKRMVLEQRVIDVMAELQTKNQHVAALDRALQECFVDI